MNDRGTIRLFRPGARLNLFGSLEYRLQIDGHDSGELWAKQIRAIRVPAGNHVVRLERLPWMGSFSQTITVEPGLTVDLVRSVSAMLFGHIRLHPATQAEKNCMDELESESGPLP